jgi:uncharacterized protein YndB with AHSA1/START domain
MDFDGSRTVAASVDAVWVVVSDANRVADWLPTVALARAVNDGSGVELAGDSHGHPYRLTTSWEVNDKERTLKWGGDDGYRGSLRVVEESSGSSVIRVNVSVPEERTASFPGAEEEIRHGMQQALDRLAALVSH